MGKRGAIALAGVLAAAGLVLAGFLASASGEGPAGSATTRLVSVQGVGVVPIGVADDAAQADAVYREGLAKALADGQAKAAFLAERAGAPLGLVVSITEDGGGIECSGSESEGSYPQYQGEQPDFGYGRSASVTAAPMASSNAVAAPTVSHRPKARRRHRTASAHKAAAEVRCNLTANVSAVYAVG